MRVWSFTFVLVLVCASSVLSSPVDSLQRQKTKSAVKIFAVPVVLVGLGLYVKSENSLINRFDVRDWRDDHFPNFQHHADDVMQFVPIGAVYALDLLKVKSRNDLLNRTLLIVKTEILMNGIVQLLKNTTNIERPVGGSHNSFPSGHTAQAFAAATFMHKELGKKSIWYSIGAYTMASTVGAFRVLNNRHWISDVLAGAGIGIFSTNVAYATHRYKWGKRPDLTILPTYSNGLGVYVSPRLD